MDYLPGLGSYYTALGLQAPLGNYPANLAHQAAQMAVLGAQNALANYDNRKHLAEYERQRWRASVSQNWLNVMLDQEIGA